MNRARLSRFAIDSFLWLQALGILTEDLQVGVINGLVNAVNGVYLVALIALAYPLRWPRSNAVLLGLAMLVVQLLTPALISLYSVEASVLLMDIGKLGAWVAVLAFSATYHSTEERVEATLTTLRRCAFTFIAAFGLFTALRLDESAYDQRILYLGTARNVPVSAMCTLALLPAFIPCKSKWRQWSGIGGLMLLLTLLMKRSSLLMGILLVAASLRYLVGGRGYARLVLWLGAPVAVLVTLLFVDVGEVYRDSPVLQRRTADFRRIQATGDLGRLGSGRLEQLKVYRSVFLEGDFFDRAFGRPVRLPDEDRPGGYLDTGKQGAPHNDLVEVLIRGGVLGLVTFLVLIALLTRRLARPSPSGLDDPGGALLFACRASGFVYLAHTFVGVFFKVQFMVVIALMIGIGLRVGAPNTISGPPRSGALGPGGQK